MSNSNEKLVSASALKTVLEREKKTNGAVFTIKSLASGKDFTYKIKRSFWRNTWYTHVLVEKGYMNFTYLGHYKNGKLLKKGEVVITPSANAIAFVLDFVKKDRIEWLDEKLHIYHMGKCLCCGRALTDAGSIERGIGPVCAGI